MERRFEIRKREIEKDAKIDKRVFAGSVRRLQQFGKPFFEHFRRSEIRENAQLILEGLLSDIHKKNVESIAYRYERDRQALQRFVGQTDWDHKPLFDRLVEQVVTEIGEEDGILAFDPSGFEKDGKKSADVARQWLGRFGKVDNGAYTHSSPWAVEFPEVSADRTECRVRSRRSSWRSIKEALTAPSRSRNPDSIIFETPMEFKIHALFFAVFPSIIS